MDLVGLGAGAPHGAAIGGIFSLERHVGLVSFTCSVGYVSRALSLNHSRDEARLVGREPGINALDLSAPLTRVMRSRWALRGGRADQYQAQRQGIAEAGTWDGDVRISADNGDGQARIGG